MGVPLVKEVFRLMLIMLSACAGGTPKSERTPSATSVTQLRND
jgi:hypothetical protein